MPPSLPRRALIGVELGPDPEPEREGLFARGVVDGSMAALAGMRAGDRLVAIDERPIGDAKDAGQAARAIGGRDAVQLKFVREGERVDVTVAVTARPAETLEDARVIYGHVQSDDARLRTLLTLPALTPAPALLLMQGIARSSIDFALDPDAALARLIRGWSEAGFATLRVEKRGVGDSEGDAGGEDLERTIAGYHAALDVLAQRDDVGPVFAFGHSLGGMVLPLLERPLAGGLVYGTSARPWSECMQASARRQLALRGQDEGKIVRHLESIRGTSYGLPPGYFGQLEVADLRAAWPCVPYPVLVMHGGFDWVVGLDEHEEIVALATSAELLRFDGLDHAFGRHDDLAASLSSFGHGAADPRPVEATVRWMRGILAAEDDR